MYRGRRVVYMGEECDVQEKCGVQGEECGVQGEKCGVHGEE